MEMRGVKISEPPALRHYTPDFITGRVWSHTQSISFKPKSCTPSSAFASFGHFLNYFILRGGRLIYTALTGHSFCVVLVTLRSNGIQ